ncbi:hypothetical protein ACH5RR_000739 [Cinchona calisaya]|uniref:Uncharacterized protein n=1 Tax=Cinchona calisaya TaxID=153742 RepID=A0ABD3B227_9GENT
MVQFDDYKKGLKRDVEFVIKYDSKHVEGMHWEVMLVDSYDNNARHLADGKIVFCTGLLKDERCSDVLIADITAHKLKEVGFLDFTRWTWIGSASFRGFNDSNMSSHPSGYDPRYAPLLRFLSFSDEDLLSTRPSSERRARMLAKAEVIKKAMDIYVRDKSGQTFSLFP